MQAPKADENVKLRHVGTSQNTDRLWKCACSGLSPVARPLAPRSREQFRSYSSTSKFLESKFGSYSYIISHSTELMLTLQTADNWTLEIIVGIDYSNLTYKLVWDPSLEHLFMHTIK